jgi:hypothetical protein
MAGRIARPGLVDSGSARDPSTAAREAPPVLGSPASRHCPQPLTLELGRHRDLYLDRKRESYWQMPKLRYIAMLAEGQSSRKSHSRMPVLARQPSSPCREQQPTPSHAGRAGTGSMLVCHGPRPESPRRSTTTSEPLEPRSNRIPGPTWDTKDTRPHGLLALYPSTSSRAPEHRCDAR